jgi:NitT/TauT family transport system permease protein
MDLLGLVGQLIVDTSASWIRMFIALGISIVVSFIIGVLAATSRTAERFTLPVVDVLQTLPILAFFPFVIYVFVGLLPGYVGINVAVIFLIITSMIWNIIFGVYESIKTLPNEVFEVVQLYHFDFWTRVKKIYIPASFPRIVEQSLLSWSIGLFYLVTSEIFSLGNSSAVCHGGTCSVTYGIGTWLVQNGPTTAGGSLTNYLIGILVFIIFVVATRFLFFKPLENYATRYTKQQAKLARPVYEQVVLNFIRRGMKSKYVKPIHAATKDIRIGTAMTRRHQALAVTSKKHTAIYIALAVFMAVISAYIFVSSPLLLADEAQVLPALAFSFARIWFAFLVIAIISVPLSVYLIFMSKQISKYITLFQVMSSIPATILLPLIVIELVGFPSHGELVAFVIFVLSGVWYMIFSMVASTRTLPNNVLELKKLFGVRGILAWKKIYLKAILPGFVTGAVTGIAAEWNASIVAEYFTTSGISGNNVISSVGTGIGKLLDLSLTSSGGLELMMLALLNLVVMILLINTFVWKRAYRNVAKIYG